jgi:hypothetical protein
MSSLLHLGHGDIPHIKFLVGCFALFVVSSNVDCYTFGMGVRQGGILSTDLYKLYINPLLDRLQDVGIGLKIGNINVNNTGCADDMF